MPLQDFTDRARKVVRLADEQAQRFRHGYLGIEHVFLGLLIEGNGVAAHVLRTFDIDLPKMRMEVEKQIADVPEVVETDERPQTPEVKKMLVHAKEESRKFNHNYIGTEHLLLGMALETNSVIGRLLSNSGVTAERIRAEVLSVLGRGIGPP